MDKDYVTLVSAAMAVEDGEPKDGDLEGVLDEPKEDETEPLPALDPDVEARLKKLWSNDTARRHVMFAMAVEVAKDPELTERVLDMHRKAAILDAARMLAECTSPHAQDPGFLVKLFSVSKSDLHSLVKAVRAAQASSVAMSLDEAAEAVSLAHAFAVTKS